MKLKQDTNLRRFILAGICTVLAFSLTGGSYLKAEVLPGQKQENSVLEDVANLPVEKNDIVQTSDFHFRTYQVGILLRVPSTSAKPEPQIFNLLVMSIPQKPAYYSFLFRYTLF